MALYDFSLNLIAHILENYLGGSWYERQIIDPDSKPTIEKDVISGQIPIKWKLTYLLFCR